MKSTRALPKFSEWQTYGGHQTGRLSYHVPVHGGPVSEHGSPGTYMLTPMFSTTGRYRGYKVLFCDAGGELTLRGAQRGLYRDVTGKLVTLPEARRAVAQDFAIHFWPRADVDFWHSALPKVANCEWLPKVGSFATGAAYMANAGDGGKLYAYVWTKTLPLPA